jgi:hypothetical protein
MKRRTFIALSAISATTLIVPFLNCTGANPELEKVLSTPVVLSHLCDSKTITAIGKTYGTKMPDEYTIKKIEDLLVRNTAGSTISAKTSPADIHSFIDKNIHEDFESGKTTILNGWVLSVTEARQSALFALLYP